MWQAWIPFWQPGNSAHAAEVDLLFAGLLATSLLVLALLFFLLVHVRDPLSRRQHSRSQPPHQEELALGGRLDGRDAGRLPRPVRLGCASLFRHLPGTGQVRCRSMSSPSNGCGRCSIRAASARSTSCTCRVGQPIRLIMASQDVIHSFFMPAFRIKRDVVPGRYQDLSFEAQRSRRLPPVLRRVSAAPIIRA